MEQLAIRANKLYSNQVDLQTGRGKYGLHFLPGFLHVGAGERARSSADCLELHVRQCGRLSLMLSIRASLQVGGRSVHSLDPHLTCFLPFHPYSHPYPR